MNLVESITIDEQIYWVLLAIRALFSGDNNLFKKCSSRYRRIQEACKLEDYDTDMRSLKDLHNELTLSDMETREALKEESQSRAKLFQKKSHSKRIFQLFREAQRRTGLTGIMDEEGNVLDDPDSVSAHIL